MSFLELIPEYFQVYDLVANPRKVFASSSNGSVTGSIRLFSDYSKSYKDLDPTFSESETGYPDNQIEATRMETFESHIEAVGNGEKTDAHGVIDSYMSDVNNLPVGARQEKRQEVLRFVPGARFDKNHGIKSTVKKILFPYYAHAYRNLDWAYTNYNCLNFFSSSTTPEDTSLIYPAFSASTTLGDVNQYAPSSSFTFDFYLKPKVNKRENPNSEYRAGTIMHMSSCFAISVVSGSSVGPDGHPDKFRLLFQLSQSADISPSSCVLTSKNPTVSKGDPGFLFCSSDNSLNRDEWHHISIRWPGGTKNGGSGSIDIDGTQDTIFIMHSSSVMQATSSNVATSDPDGLFIGNYYEGTNTGNQSIIRFFNHVAALNEGVTGAPFSGSLSGEPEGIYLRHPAQAEVHEIKIFNKKKTDKDVAAFREKGVSLSDDLLFYVPPFFTQESRDRSILQTPFTEHLSTETKTNDPFNVALSFGVGGLEINLENFTREFVKKEYPRLLNMTSSVVTKAVFQEGKTSDDILYSSGSSINRLYSILPCDNGKFRPRFSLLSTSSNMSTKFVDSFGSERLDLITLDNLVSTDGLPTNLMYLDTVPQRTITDTGVLSIPDSIDGAGSVTNVTGSFLFEELGASPEDPSVSPGNILTILQRTGDPSSNQIVFFDASNMFYGDTIRPGSVLIEDLDPVGSNESFDLKLKDDGMGNIYRADAKSKHATWASVGNVFYGDGIIILKSPHLSLFGKNSFRITFEGERKVYVFEISVPVPQNLFNSSSNPQYQKLMPSNGYNETASEFTYITGVQLHDENFNVVGRAHLAQPFTKRDGDRVVIKLRMDY